MKVLELYSGIGGMHMALKSSQVEGVIKASIDINPTANAIYKHNFPEVLLLHRNIQSLTPKFINKLAVDTILMSPPCQPFTRNGLQLDVDDERTRSFKHILTILPLLEIKRILIENVKGFETSQMRNLLIQTLQECNFTYQEFILTPTQLGIPNSRNRYYCIAKKLPETFTFPVGPLMHEFPMQAPKNCFVIGKILEENVELSEYRVKDKLLKSHADILDICFENSRTSNCFTKSYGRYIEGTGSVFTEKTENCVKLAFKEMENCKAGSEERLGIVQKLNIRFFTPREICRLMNFAETFTFPTGISNRQKYMVLGNSINVKVVAELIKLFN